MANAEIVYQLIEQVHFDLVDASISLPEGPICVPAGENPTAVTRFFYNVGNPPADRFLLLFYLNEADAEADRDAIDVDAFLTYSLNPERPFEEALPLSTLDGFLTLTRRGEIPYPRLCVKLSICQPSVDPFNPIGDPKRNPVGPLRPPRRRHIPTWENNP